MKQWYKNICIAMVTFIILTGCQKEIPHYRGYYFNAMIGDARVIELKDSESIPALKDYVRDVLWKLDKPIDGDIAVHFSENENSKSFIGNIMRRESMGIVPLTRVNIESDAALKSDNSVRISGASAVSRVNVLKKNHLPKGDYVLRLKVHGTDNWDRKEIYVQVR